MTHPITIMMWSRYYVYICTCSYVIATILNRILIPVALKLPLIFLETEQLRIIKNDFWQYNAPHDITTFLHITCVLVLVHITFTLSHKLSFSSHSLSGDQILGSVLPLHHYLTSGFWTWFLILKIRIPALAYFTRYLYKSSTICDCYVDHNAVQMSELT